MQLPKSDKPIQIDEIRRLLPPAPTFVEIGANDGSDTAMLASIKGSSIHCFECDPRPIERFRANMASMRRGSTVRLYEYAIGKEDGWATFHQSGGTTEGAHIEDWDLSGSLRKPTGHMERHQWCKFDKVIRVETRRLDSWYATVMPAKHIDMIWMDVQGAESDVIEGGRAALRNASYIYTEFNDWAVPLYEGSLGLEQTLAMLGPDWEALRIYESYNVLCRNKTVKR